MQHPGGGGGWRGRDGESRIGKDGGRETDVTRRTRDAQTDI